MLLTLRGTPFLYQGEEIGMADGPVPPARTVDVAERDPERTPMQWGSTEKAGFTNADPWLPVNPESASVNVAVQRGDPRSMLELYRTLIRVRRSSPALRRGSYRSSDAASDDVFAYLRELGAERWFIALNFAEEVRVVSVPAGINGSAARLCVSTDPDRDLAALIPGDAIELAPDEGVLVSFGKAEVTS
jgi:alpha-glucosidase